MKTMKKLVLIILVISLLPLQAVAAEWRIFKEKPGTTVVCAVTDKDLQDSNIVLIDENKDETVTDGSGTSDITVEDEDVERRLPSLVFGDGFIEINGVRYPYDIIKSTTGFKDVTDQLIDDAANDPSIHVYKQTLGIDGDIIGKILEGGSLPDDFDLGDFISNWERILREIDEEAKDLEPSITLEDLEKQLEEVFSGKTIQGELDRIIDGIIAWLKDNKISWKTFNKERWDSFLESLAAHQQLVNQRLHILEKGSLSGDVSIIPTAEMTADARVNGDSGLVYDVGETTYTFTLMTPQYEDDREFVKQVTQKAMAEAPMDVVAGRLATGNLTVDGHPSALYEYTENVRKGLIQDTPAGFVAAYEKDLPLLEAYYTLYAKGEINAATGSIDAASYAGASGKITIPFGEEEKSLMFNRMQAYGNESGVLGWYVNPDVIGSDEYNTYHLHSQTGESIASGQAVGRVGSQNNEPSTKLTKEEKQLQDKGLDTLTDNGALDWRIYGDDWNFNSIDTTGLDLVTDKEFMGEVVVYWQQKAEDASLTAEERAIAAETLEAAKSLQQLNEIDASRVIEEDPDPQSPSYVPGPTVYGTHPSDSNETAYLWSKYEGQAAAMRGVFNTTYMSSGVYAGSRTTTQNGDPTMEQMQKLGFDTSGGMQLNITIPNTEKNADALRVCEALELYVANGVVGREQVEAYLALAQIYDIDGNLVDTTQQQRAVSSWIDNGHMHASVSADGTSTKDNKGYIYRAGLHDGTETSAPTTVRVNGEGFNNTELALSDIPQTAENIASMENIKTTAELYRRGEATVSQLEECVKNYPLYDKDGVPIPPSTVLKTYKPEQQVQQQTQETAQPSASKAQLNDAYWLIPYSSLYWLQTLGEDGPMEQDQFDSMMGKVSTKDGLGEAIIGTRMYSDKLPEGTAVAGHEYRIGYTDDFKVGDKYIWTHDSVIMDGEHIQILDKKQTDTRTGGYITGLDLFGLNGSISSMSRETWDYKRFTGVTDDDPIMRLDGNVDAIIRLGEGNQFPETVEEYEAFASKMRYVYYGGTYYVLPTTQRGIAIRNEEVGAISADTHALTSDDVKVYGAYWNDMYVLSDPDNKNADEGKTFIIVDKERMEQMIEANNLIPEWLKPYLERRIPVAGSDEPITWEFNASAYVRDNTPSIDLDSFFDSHEESLYDALDRLTGGDIISSFTMLKKETEEAKKAMEKAEKKLKEAKTEEEKREAEEAIEAAKRKQSQYDSTVAALRLIYEYYITYGDDMDPAEWELYGDMIDAGRQLFPDLRTREEEKKQRKIEHGIEEEESLPETEEDVKMRLSSELIEFLISLGIAEDEIPDKITLGWLKEKVGIEEIKKFFTGRTIYVDHYVTIKAENIKIVDSEYCQFKKGSNFQWRSWLEGSQPPKIPQLGDRTRSFVLGNDTLYVTADAEVQRGRLIKTYFSSRETLIAQPFGWVISDKTAGGAGIDNEPMLLSKKTQIVFGTKNVGKWMFPIDETAINEEPTEQVLLFGTITSIMRTIINGGYWINGYKYDGSGVIEIKIEGTSDPGLTYRIK